MRTLLRLITAWPLLLLLTSQNIVYRTQAQTSLVELGHSNPTVDLKNDYRSVWKLYSLPTDNLPTNESHWLDPCLVASCTAHDSDDVLTQLTYWRNTAYCAFGLLASPHDDEEKYSNLSWEHIPDAPDVVSVQDWTKQLAMRLTISGIVIILELIISLSPLGGIKSPFIMKVSKSSFSSSQGLVSAFTVRSKQIKNCGQKSTRITSQFFWLVEAIIQLFVGVVWLPALITLYFRGLTWTTFMWNVETRSISYLCVLGFYCLAFKLLTPMILNRHCTGKPHSSKLPISAQGDGPVGNRLSSESFTTQLTDSVYQNHLKKQVQREQRASRILRSSRSTHKVGDQAGRVGPDAESTRSNSSSEKGFSNDSTVDSSDSGTRLHGLTESANSRKAAIGSGKRSRKQAAEKENELRCIELAAGRPHTAKCLTYSTKHVHRLKADHLIKDHNLTRAELEIDRRTANETEGQVWARLFLKRNPSWHDNHLFIPSAFFCANRASKEHFVVELQRSAEDVRTAAILPESSANVSTTVSMVQSTAVEEHLEPYIPSIHSLQNDYMGFDEDAIWKDVNLDGSFMAVPDSADAPAMKNAGTTTLTGPPGVEEDATMDFEPDLRHAQRQMYRAICRCKTHTDSCDRNQFANGGTVCVTCDAAFSWSDEALPYIITSENSSQKLCRCKWHDSDCRELKAEYDARKCKCCKGWYAFSEQATELLVDCANANMR